MSQEKCCGTCKYARFEQGLTKVACRYELPFWAFDLVNDAPNRPYEVRRSDGMFCPTWEPTQHIPLEVPK